MQKLDAVDLVVLSRDDSPLHPRVQQAIDSQQGVRIVLHRIVGTPREGDINKWVTIARARNRAKLCGHAPWLMFLDDDVVIPSDCVEKLVQAIKDSPELGAVAADYQKKARPRHGTVQHHVALGATLFDRN
ncbi:MAG: glycosyltransferase family A protein, partial [Planctomycetota bacterium]